MKTAILKKIDEDDVMIRMDGLTENQLRLKAQYAAPPGEYILEFYMDKRLSDIPYLTEAVTIQGTYSKIPGKTLPEKGKYAGKKNELKKHSAPSDKNTSHFASWRSKKPKVVNEEQPEYNEDGRGRHKVNYVHPDEKNIGNDRFETKTQAKKFANSLKKKGYKNVNIGEEEHSGYRFTTLTAEEAQAINELSGKTLVNYKKKSTKEADKLWKDDPLDDGPWEKAPKNNKLLNRGMGMARANMKLKKKITNEDLENLGELSASTMNSYMRKSSDQILSGKLDKKKSEKRNKGMTVAKLLKKRAKM